MKTRAQLVFVPFVDAGRRSRGLNLDMDPCCLEVSSCARTGCTVRNTTLYLLIRLATVFTNVCVGESVTRKTILTAKQTPHSPICTVPTSPRTPQPTLTQRGTASQTRQHESAGARPRRKRWCSSHKGRHSGMNMKDLGRSSYTKRILG